MHFVIYRSLLKEDLCLCPKESNVFDPAIGYSSGLLGTKCAQILNGIESLICHPSKNKTEFYRCEKGRKNTSPYNPSQAQFKKQLNCNRKEQLAIIKVTIKTKEANRLSDCVKIKIPFKLYQTKEPDSLSGMRCARQTGNHSCAPPKIPA